MLDTILKAVKLAGVATPAFKVLYDAAMATMKPQDQAVAKSAYEAAKADSDQLHGELQNEFDKLDAVGRDEMSPGG